MSNNDISKTTPAAKLKQLTHKSLGDKVPRRGGSISPPIARRLFKLLGWKAVGEIPNVPKAVLLALPHTSNFDGLYAIPLILGLDLDINIMGKDSLFKYPILARFFKWAGIIPINRSKRGTVLQASIDRLKSSESLYLGLAPEGTRDYTDKWKTGFYYIADGAQVPIIPVAMDYKTKEIRFLNLVYTTGDYDKDVMKIVEQYKGVVPKYPEKMSKPLKDINK